MIINFSGINQACNMNTTLKLKLFQTFLVNWVLLFNQMLVFLSRKFERGLTTHRNIDRTKTLRKTERKRERERIRFYFSKYVPTLNFVNIFIFWLVSNFRVNNLQIEILTSKRIKHELMAVTLPGLVFKQVKMSLLLS